MKLWLICVLAASCIVVLLATARAHDYQHPNLDDWYAALRQPDMPTMSCCGKADGYFADVTEECPPLADNCALVAVITDTRTIQEQPRYTKEPVPAGTRIIIPKNKIRMHPIPNPTEHSVIFLAGNLSVYCYEPLPLI